MVIKHHNISAQELYDYYLTTKMYNYLHHYDTLNNICNDILIRYGVPWYNPFIPQHVRNNLYRKMKQLESQNS